MRRFLAICAVSLASSFSLNAQEHGRPSTTPTPRPPSTSTPRPPSISTPPQTMRDTSVPDSSGWVRFSSGLGRFSVLMPSTPTDKVETTQSEHGPYTTHLFIVKDTSVYLIGWVDYDPTFNFNRQSELEANRDNFVKGIQATLLTSSPTTIDGYQAIEFVCETSDRVFKSRVYMVGRRPYQIVIGTAKGQDDSVQASRFFNSFKIRPS